MDVIIRKLSDDDVDNVIEVARDSWKWAYNDIYSDEFIENWISEKYSKEKLLNEITKSQLTLDLIFLGSFHESKLIGFIELKISSSKAELLRLYLRPEYTHREVGRILLSEAEELVKKRDVEEFILYVHKKNYIATSFYKKNGFQVKDIYGDDLIMIKRYKV